MVQWDSEARLGMLSKQHCSERRGLGCAAFVKTPSTYILPPWLLSGSQDAGPEQGEGRVAHNWPLEAGVSGPITRWQDIPCGPVTELLVC